MIVCGSKASIWGAVGLLLCALCVWLSSPADAGQRRVAQADVQAYLAQVRRLYQQGATLTNRKKYKQATVFYLEALRWLRKAAPAARGKVKRGIVRSEGKFFYVIARNYLLGQQCQQAIEYFDKVVATPVYQSVKQKVTHYRNRASIMPACRPIQVRISSTPSGAVVVLRRGKVVKRGVTPQRWLLRPGEWKVTASKRQFHTQRQTLALVPKRPRMLHLKLQQIRTAKTSPVVSRQPVMWPRWLLLGASVAVVAAGAVTLGVAGAELNAVAQQQGTPIAGVPEDQTFSRLKPRYDGGVAALGVGVALVGVGAIGAGLAAWWMTKGSPPRATASLPASVSASRSMMVLP